MNNMTGVQGQAAAYKRAPESHIALCLSGGGYRAMLFHIGAIWRLIELGLLDGTCKTTLPGERQERNLGSLSLISSVSGGSLVAAKLGQEWKNLKIGSPDTLKHYLERVAKPLCHLATKTLAGFTAQGMFKLAEDVISPGPVGNQIADYLDTNLYNHAKLDELPVKPIFQLDSTNLQSGVLFRFRRDYIRDWRVGVMTDTHKISLASAVAASAAFPPFLSPVTLYFDVNDFQPNALSDPSKNLCFEPYTTQVQLTDGGVYDNLGLETPLKECMTLLVSNGGAPLVSMSTVETDWINLARRSSDIMGTALVNRRVIALCEAFKNRERIGAYWGIEEDIKTHNAPDKLYCNVTNTRMLAAIDTDLATKDESQQHRLINWGYGVTDASVRAHLLPGTTPPKQFPFPKHPP